MNKKNQTANFLSAVQSCRHLSRPQLATRLTMTTGLIAHLVSAPRAEAKVLLLTGAYQTSHDDLGDLPNRSRTKLVSSPFPQLHRTYNSRSLHRGLFGFGWCSEFEKTLRFSGTQVYLKDCLQSQEIKFVLTGNRYINESSPDEFLSQRKNRWRYHAKDGVIFEFNSQGQLDKILKNQDKIELFYNQSGELYRLIYQTRDSHISKLNFEYDRSRRVSKIFFISQESYAEANTLNLSYLYHHDDLHEVRAEGLVTTSYDYDEFHNLVKRQASKQSELIHYVPDLDIVQSLMTSSGCLEHFTFELANLHKQSTTIVKKCAGQNATQVIVHFQLASTPQRDITVVTDQRLRHYYLNDHEELIPLAGRRKNEPLRTGGLHDH